MHHERKNHIDIRLHFIRDEIAEGKVRLEKVHTNRNPVHMLTKSLPATKFKLCLNLVGTNSN